MSKKLYVGNLGRDVRSADLERLFTDHGTVESAQIISDRITGESKGFGFVEMSSSEQAQAAIAALDGKEFGGRTLKVSEARPRAAGGSGRRGRR